MSLCEIRSPVDSGSNLLIFSQEAFPSSLARKASFLKPESP
jgi:hypothetical protein